MWIFLSALVGPLLNFVLGLFKSEQAKKLDDDDNALQQIKKGTQAIIDSSHPDISDKLRTEYQRD